MKRESYTVEQYRDLGASVRQQILQSYRADSCIATVRATLDVLRELDVEAYALPVRAIVVNEPLYQYAVEHEGVYPAVGSGNYPLDGYGIGIGYIGESLDGHWDGHLITVAERHWLLDFSLDQASRPEHGIHLNRPLVFETDEMFLRGRKTVCYHAGDAYVYYTAMPGDDGFKASPNWSGKSRPHVHIKAGDRVVPVRRSIGDRWAGKLHR